MTSRTGALLVVSPHLDDAVLSCGGYLEAHPGAVVLTIFAGSPPPTQPLVAWDAACGFGPGDDVMAARRAEDANALCLLGASPWWCGELQEGYGSGQPDASVITALIAAAMREISPSQVLVPLGLRHRDHVVVAAAGLEALRQAAPRDALLYADQPYDYHHPLAGAFKRRQLRTGGVVTRRAKVPRSARRAKASVLRCYSTQLRGLGISATRMSLVRQSYWHVDLSEESPRMPETPHRAEIGP